MFNLRTMFRVEDCESLSPLGGGGFVPHPHPASLVREILAARNMQPVDAGHIL